jgi:hypothetical protein
MAQVGISIEAARGIISGGTSTTTALAAVTAAVAAAQLIGAGDASAEIDAVDAALVAAIAADDALGVVVRIPSTITRAQLRKALDNAYNHFVNNAGVVTS